MTKHIFVLIFMASMIGGLQAQHLPQASYKPGTYTWNTGNFIFSSVTIRAWGGGAGGATGTQGNGGGGGGGGAFAERFFSTIGPNQTVTLVVGAGGLAGVPGGNFGQPGGDSYFVVTSQETRAGGGRIQSPDYFSPSTGGVPSGTMDIGFNGGGGAGRTGQRGGGGGSSAGTSAPGVTATGTNGAVAPVGGGNGGSSGVGPSDPAFPGQIPGGGGGGCQKQGGVGGEGLITISYVIVEEDAPLPVELTFFNAAIQTDKSILVSWTYANAIDFERFAVEHSTDGRLWTEIGSVDLPGLLLRSNELSYTHRNPVAGHNYYRLRMIDLDGTYSLSDVEQVFIESEKLIYLVNTTVHTNVLIQRGDSDEDTHIMIYDLNGRSVHRSNLMSGESLIQLDVSGLTPGMYILHVSSLQRKEAHKIMKVQ